MSQQVKSTASRLRFAGLAAASCAIVLSACGGGGGNENPSAPRITAQPQSATVANGTSATFAVRAAGTGPLSYQWTRNGANISGATAATYVKPNVQPSDSAEVIRVNVTNSLGSTTSDAVTLWSSGPGIHHFAGSIPRPSGASSDGLGQEAYFSVPSGLGIDAAGMLYVADFASRTLRKITPAGQSSTVAGMRNVEGSYDGIGTAARFVRPDRLAVTRNGSVLLQDNFDFQAPLRVIKPGGIVTTVSLPLDRYETNADGSQAQTLIVGFSIDAADNTYIITMAAMLGRCEPWQSGPDCPGTYNRMALRKVNADAATTLATSESMYAANKELLLPSAVAADAAGNVFFSNLYQIMKLSPGGAITALAGDRNASGTADGTGASARFSWVNHMAFDSKGNLFVIDGSAGDPQRIRKITPAGVVTTVAGSTVAGPTMAGNLPGTLSQLRGLAIDKNDKLYVSTNYAILKIILP
jgi:hypothetical protein